MQSSFVPCPGCARHVRAHESACPFCEQSLTRDDPSIPGGPRWYAAAAVSATLVISGCTQPASAARSGGPPRPSGTVDSPARLTAPNGASAADPGGGAPRQRESFDIYGAPPPRDVRDE
jgi:hypothetical protein